MTTSDAYNFLNLIVLFFMISTAFTVVLYFDFSSNNYYLGNQKKLLRFIKAFAIIPFIINTSTLVLLAVFYITSFFVDSLMLLLVFLPALFLGEISASICLPIEILSIIFSYTYTKNNQNSKGKKYIILSSISLVFSLGFLFSTLYLISK